MGGITAGQRRAGTANGPAIGRELARAVTLGTLAVLGIEVVLPALLALAAR